MRRAVIALPVIALLAGGCGAAGETQESRFTGDQAEVAQVVDNLAAAGRARDARTICADILAPQLLRDIRAADGDCVSEMDRAIRDASDFDLQVVKVDVNGTTATATVRQGEDAKNTATFTFVKDRGEWRATALGTS
ncbi:hypothetical protein DVA67_014785 [Solirubrobacter sp. CPCC 204708]|uniref:DUF4878 domain-containing protein n=1 Tax=Solirubrobacter deserti TaxID=2282478 RepID=A0ABT4RBF4_9ACTN|nr:hypothetical protein [Solirubrobacter deserti]MBE2317245.1 hypothetical protein [Solirubrobacter deserti]MDA0135863.1 hypothetical protein [Solirubrobacter deserti]